MSLTMKFVDEVINNPDELSSKGYSLPEYNRDQMIRNTCDNPVWVHFGAGNIFRAFHANIAQRLLNNGQMDKGIIVIEGYDAEIIDKMYRPNNNYSILVTLKGNGTISKTVIGSVAESCVLDSNRSAEFDRVKEIFTKCSLQMATFTITEKGYSLTGADGNLLKNVAADSVNGPEKPESYCGKVASLLYSRFKAGAKPIAMVSTDNCSNNGDKLHNAISFFAKKWTNGLAEKDFLDYIEDEARVSFPCSVIDKITPRPDPAVEDMIKEDKLDIAEPIITSLHTYVAPFVNAEETEYLVIEDKFPNGRPKLEEAGVMFTDKETVFKVEQMKVCTCLNPLHTALAVFGCLLGYTRISDEMKDENLVSLIKNIGYKEGMPVVTDPGIINPKSFIDTVMEERLPNPFMPDTPQRIVSDTSQKLAIRYGNTIKCYIEQEKDISELKMIPLVFAGWLRYLMGIDDNGKKYELSPDPMIKALMPYFSKIKIGVKNDTENIFRDMFENEQIWGVNLIRTGMAKMVCQYFDELTAGMGAVRNTLIKYTK